MKIIELEKTNLDLIADLWSQLNHIHFEKSAHFRQHFSQMDFGKRKASLLKKDKLVVYGLENENHYVGYCIASVKDGQGEIDSIYLLASVKTTFLYGSLKADYFSG